MSDSWDAPPRGERCVMGLLCARHAAEARDAADAAERDYLAARTHLPARDVARGAYGARTYASQRAVERPLTPCTDGSRGLGWPDPEEDP